MGELSRKTARVLNPALIGLLIAGIASAVPVENGFDLSNATIPADEILPGGPPRDGIPSIDEPRFISPRNAVFMRDDDLVISLSVGGETRAYPLRILVWHEIANDVIGSQPVAVTYCPLCGTAMVFERRIGGRTRSFGVSGLLYQSDVLMYDRQSESLWSQLAMKAVSGPMAGKELRLLPSEHSTWAAWRKAHPGGKVLSTNTGHARDYDTTPYSGYERSDEAMFPARWKRTELGKKEWIVGVIIGGGAKAYPLLGLEKRPGIDDRVGGEPIRITYDASARKPAVVHAETGEPLPYTMAYWFAWQAFYPETELYGP
jgi:Protein of unknown function (DUF3179)